MLRKGTFWRASTIIALGFLVLLAGCSTLPWQSGRKVFSVEIENNRLTLEVSDGMVRLTALTNQAIEVEFLELGAKPQPQSVSITEGLGVEVSVRMERHFIEFSTPELTALIQKSPMRISFLKDDRSIIEEEKGFFRQENVAGFRFFLDDNEKLMGGGSRALGMDRRGHRLQLYNKPSYGYETEAELMYYSMPVVISSKQYSLVFDNGASGWMDLGFTEPDILQFDAVGGRMSYYVVAGDDWENLMDEFTQVTGNQPLPPRWVIGNISSRMGYRSREQVESVVEGYRSADIPLDGIVLDVYWFGPDLKGHMGNLDWDLENFPRPIEMMANLKDQGVKTILITEPFVLNTSSKYDICIENGYFGTTADGEPYIYDFYFGTTGLIDIFKDEAKDWFWSVYKRHTLTGVDGWWGDLGEPEVHPDDLYHVNGSALEVHNLYGHEWAKLIADGYERDFANQRPVILMRSGFVGSQRYGMIPWTGDVSRTWGGLQSQVEIALQMSLQGLAYIHSDLGGFAGDYEDAELYTRWLQYGVFQPIYRTHAQDTVPAEPIYWDEETQRIVRDFIKLRYSLTPYLYTMMWENSQNGMPLMRPLFFEEYEFDQIQETKTYLWGDDFLVTPIVEKGVEGAEVDLPGGSAWFDFWTGERFEGGQTLFSEHSIETIPVFVRAGAIIPMIPEVQTLDSFPGDQLILNYYHDETISTANDGIYEDDGKTPNAFEKGEYEWMEVNVSNEDKSLTATITRSRTYPGNGDETHVVLKIHNWGSTSSEVSINGETSETNFDYDPDSHLLSVPFKIADQVVVQISK